MVQSIDGRGFGRSVGCHLHQHHHHHHHRHHHELQVYDVDCFKFQFETRFTIQPGLASPIERTLLPFISLLAFCVIIAVLRLCLRRAAVRPTAHSARVLCLLADKRN